MKTGNVDLPTSASGSTHEWNAIRAHYATGTDWYRMRPASRQDKRLGHEINTLKSRTKIPVEGIVLFLLCVVFPTPTKERTKQAPGVYVWITGKVSKFSLYRKWSQFSGRMQALHIEGSWFNPLHFQEGKRKMPIWNYGRLLPICVDCTELS